MAYETPIEAGDPPFIPPPWLDPTVPIEDVPAPIVVPVAPDPSDQDTVPTTPDHNN